MSSSKVEIGQPGDARVIRCGLVLTISIALGSAAAAGCKAEVDDAFAKLRGSKGFRLETKIVNEQQGSLTMTVDYQLPDRMHQRVMMGDGPARMETIAVGGKVWSNQGQGWTEVPANFAEVITKQLKDSVAEPSKSKLDYECLGDASLEGKSYVAYKALLPAVTEEKVKGDKDAPKLPDNVQTLYVDKSSGLPVRNIVTKGDGSDKRLFDGTFSTPDDLAIKAPG
jgi:hypothetical protein